MIFIYREKDQYLRNHQALLFFLFIGGDCSRRNLYVYCVFAFSMDATDCYDLQINKSAKI